MSTLETIVEDLKALPTPQLAQVADYVHRLREAGRDQRNAAIARSALILTEAESTELDHIIREGCETINARDWSHVKNGVAA